MLAAFQSLDVWQLLCLTISALLIGINKTALPGLGLLPVMLLVSAFDAKSSTGLQLGMLAATDIFAVLWYRRYADWRLLLQLLPWAVAGLLIGCVILQFVPTDRSMKILIGATVLALAVLNFVRTHLRPEQIPSGLAFSAFFGILLGSTTLLANAAGPVAAIYFLSMRLPKEKYMGTTAWFFLLINWIKLPLFVAQGRITMQSVCLDIWMLPVLLAGAAAGILLFKKMPQKVFNLAVQLLVIAAAVKLLLS